MFYTPWVEIPALDIERAAKFYQTVFDLPTAEIRSEDVRRTVTLFSGSQEGRAGISLTQTAHFEPSQNGVFVYLDVGTDLTGAMSRVVPAGGKILTDKTSMGGAGFYTAVLDTEGNQIGLFGSQ